MGGLCTWPIDFKCNAEQSKYRPTEWFSNITVNAHFHRYLYIIYQCQCVCVWWRLIRVCRLLIITHLWGWVWTTSQCLSCGSLGFQQLVLMFRNSWSRVLKVWDQTLSRRHVHHFRTLLSFKLRGTANSLRSRTQSHFAMRWFHPALSWSNCHSLSWISVTTRQVTSSEACRCMSS